MFKELFDLVSTEGSGIPCYLDSGKQVTSPFVCTRVLEEIIEQVPLRIFWKDQNSRFLGCNTHFAKDAGYKSPYQLIGKTDFDMPWSSQAHLYIKDDEEVMRTLTPKLSYEEPQSTPDGKTVSVTTSKLLLQDNQGKVVGVLGIYQDVTEQRVLRLKLEESEHRYASVIEYSSEGFWLTDRSGYIQQSNPAYAFLSGYSIEELIGKHITDLEAKETLEETHQHIRQVIEKNSDTFETIHRRKDGTLWNVEVSASFIAEGEGYFVAFFRDITQRKILEQLHHEKQARLSALFNTTAIGIVVINDRGLIEEFNGVCSSMFGYRREELLGKNVSFLMPEPDASQHDEYLRNYRNGGPGKIIGIGREVIAKRKDETLFPMELLVGDVELDGKKAFIGFVKDVSERKRTEQELLIAATAFETQEGTVITDSETNIIRVNRAFTKITGYEADEVVGKKTNILKSGYHGAEFYREMYESLDQSGNWQGEVFDRHKDGHVYPKWLTITSVKNSQGETTHYVANFFDITERKAAEERIQKLAFYDTLTNLPNRRLFLEKLNHAARSIERNQKHCAVLYLDLDNFKILNDTQGHKIGDELLIEVALRLNSCVRQTDTIARLGGDEFVVLLEDLDQEVETAARQSKIIAEKILSNLSQPYLFNNVIHRSSSSIGIVLFSKQNENIDAMLSQADTAMYEAKKNGRNTYRFFNPEMQRALEHRIFIETELRLALEREQIKLVFQPQVDAEGNLTGSEILIRWHHPVFGLLLPGSFISIAEDTEIILDIGKWVLHRACTQLSEWQEDDTTAHLSLAVNVSAKQFYQTSFVEEIKDLIKLHKIDPRKLKLEFTESMVLEDTVEAIKKMYELKELGLLLSMDDFGTGYSSLSYLKELPFDQLKVDKSFIQDIRKHSDSVFIVETVIVLGKKLGMDVLAEGVEELEQLNLLHELGCVSYQGYLFGKPMELVEFEKLVRQQVNQNLIRGR